MNYVCDLCGLQTPDEDAIYQHMRAGHGLANPGPVGSITQEDGTLTLQSGARTTVIDLAAWLGVLLRDDGRPA